MSREKSRTSNALAAAHEKFLQLCADKAVELQRKERKHICEQVLRALKSRYEHEIASLKAEVDELKNSLAFVFAQYNDIIKQKANQGIAINDLTVKYENL